MQYCISLEKDCSVSYRYKGTLVQVRTSCKTLWILRYKQHHFIYRPKEDINCKSNCFDFVVMAISHVHLDIEHINKSIYKSINGSNKISAKSSREVLKSDALHIVLVCAQSRNDRQHTIKKRLCNCLTQSWLNFQELQKQVKRENFF